jgi:hypothetical protein
MFKTPGNQSPGGSYRSAPYTKTYTNPTGVDLTEEVPQAKGATTEFQIYALAAGAVTLTWLDGAGASSTFTLTAAAAGWVGTFLYGATTFVSANANTFVTVCWHGQSR